MLTALLLYLIFARVHGNGYTGMAQNHVSIRTCGFESRLRRSQSGLKRETENRPLSPLLYCLGCGKSLSNCGLTRVVSILLFVVLHYSHI